ncbi:GNAT family N-acetyltransferase [Virgibacillus flavescens]|uniref:GNAT family N-acetyltransferase n=1 Tax=Virgibacillus flavescens TaxID=1611422 RepID=UPI003D350A91
MNIRKALEEEAGVLSCVAIKSKAYWDYDEKFINECKEDLTISTLYIQENYAYILEDEQGIIGFFAFEAGEHNSLDFLYILPRFIGKGYGKVMWAKIIQKAKEFGMKTFTIDSDPHAKGYYEKMGAYQIAETPSTVYKDRLLPLMRVNVD